MFKTNINGVEVKSHRKIDYGDNKQYKRSTIPDIDQNIKIESITFERVDLEEDYKKKMKNGETFLITNPEYIKNGVRLKDSIFSPLFGPDMLKPDAHSYMCECGALVGAINEDRVCSKCKSKVQFITTDLTKNAFIDIAPYKILTYHGYNILNKYIKNIDEVLGNTKKINMKGHQDDPDKMDIIDLYEYYEKHEDEIGVPIGVAFTSKIPVINANVRPLVKTDSKMTLFTINKEFNVIVSSLTNLNVAKYINNRTETVSLLNTIQEAYFNICREMEERLEGKTGDFRAQFTTCKTDYSSRMVIAPGLGLKPYEIDVPYQTIIEFYEEELINILNAMGLSHEAAMDIYLRGRNKISNHMKRAIKILLKTERWLIINRNPTIKYGSILYMRIRKFNKNIKDTTMKLPHAILPLMNADYDGDQLTGLASKLAISSSKSYHDIFKSVFCPIYLFIDSGTGKMNRAMTFKKDHAVILTDLKQLSDTLNYFQNDASDAELENLLSYRGTLNDMNTYEAIVANLVNNSVSNLGPDDDDPEDLIRSSMNIYLEKWEADFEANPLDNEDDE
jgi:hypothetical protein